MIDVKGNVKVISYRANRIKYNSTDPAELRSIADYMEHELDIAIFN